MIKRYREREMDGIIFAKGQVWRCNSNPQAYRLIDSVMVDKERDNELRIMSRYADETGDHVWAMNLHETGILLSNFWLDPKGLKVKHV